MTVQIMTLKLFFDFHSTVQLSKTRRGLASLLLLHSSEAAFFFEGSSRGDVSGTLEFEEEEGSAILATTISSSSSSFASSNALAEEIADLDMNFFVGDRADFFRALGLNVRAFEESFLLLELVS